jgi:hypothetical protein
MLALFSSFVRRLKQLRVRALRHSSSAGLAQEEERGFRKAERAISSMASSSNFSRRDLFGIVAAVLLSWLGCEVLPAASSPYVPDISPQGHLARAAAAMTQQQMFIIQSFRGQMYISDELDVQDTPIYDTDTFEWEFASARARANPATRRDRREKRQRQRRIAA